MNFFFKIKHYAFLYFKFSKAYNCISLSKQESPNKHYWLTGYSSNITNKKWQIENGIPLGLYNKSWKGGLHKRTHICALCEYFFALDELGKNHKQSQIVEFILNNLSEGKIPKLIKNICFGRHTWTKKVKIILFMEWDRDNYSLCWLEQIYKSTT